MNYFNNLWRKCTGIEPADAPLSRTSIGFEDRARHQSRTHFRAHYSITYTACQMTLPDTLQALCRAVDEGQAFTYRYFWGHRARADGRLTDSVFSQWWPCRFEVDGIEYVSAEQFMMAGKARLFDDSETLEKILVATEPPEQKALGRKVRGFDDDAWAKARFELVTRGNVAKFGQDAALREYLLGTGDEILVEASPTDRIWGIGLAQKAPEALDPRTWQGQNLLGFALVKAREILRTA